LPCSNASGMAARETMHQQNRRIHHRYPILKTLLKITGGAALISDPLPGKCGRLHMRAPTASLRSSSMRSEDGHIATAADRAGGIITRQRIGHDRSRDGLQPPAVLLLMVSRGPADILCRRSAPAERGVADPERSCPSNKSGRGRLEAVLRYSGAVRSRTYGAQRRAGQ